MTPRLLMCPPDHYGIEYEINPWMSRARPSNPGIAMEQWQALRQQLVNAGASVELMEPLPGMPDLVFTANAALIHHQTAVISRFRHPQRQLEEPHNTAWFSEHGFQVATLPADANFEGAGDALFCGETLFAGYRIRSDARVHQEVALRLGCRVIPLELVDDYYYHLDTCFCPLNRETALYFPDAFDAYGRRALLEHVPRLIAVDEGEARRFGCNAVVVGKTVISNTGCPRMHQQLADHGFDTLATPLDEFVKAGGSAKCLTLRLDGEEAASWRERG